MNGLDLDGLPHLVALSLWFIASAPTEAHAEQHIATARERGATDQQIDDALALMRDQQAAGVQTIGGQQ